jgi:putative heme iron utilization protein
VAGDPLEGARIMLAGQAEEAGADDLEVIRRRYLNVHPSAEVFADFKDFSSFVSAPRASIWWPGSDGSSICCPSNS